MAFPIQSVVNQRILSWVNQEAGFDNYRKIVVALAEPLGELLDVIEQIQNSFYLNTAVGDQLDKLGSIVGLARSGFTDSAYRRNLRIQIEIIASRLRELGGVDGNWTGTINSLLKIIELFTGDPNNNYQPVYPYSFQVQINTPLTTLEIQELFQLIRRAIYAGVLGLTIFLLPGDNLWAYAEDIGGGDGKWDPGAVPGEGLWAYALPYLQVWQVDAFGVFIDQTAGFIGPGGVDFFPLPGVSTLGDYCAYGSPQPFFGMVLNNPAGAPGLDGVVSWEYWTGASWALLPGIVDGTLSYGEVPSSGQAVTWDSPTGWNTLSLNGGPEFYYVRSVTTVLYTAFPEYDDGLFDGTQYGIWDAGAIAGEAVWNTVFSTAADATLANDNT